MVRMPKAERTNKIRSWTKTMRSNTAGGIDIMRTLGGVDEVPTTRRACEVKMVSIMRRD